MTQSHRSDDPERSGKFTHLGEVLSGLLQQVRPLGDRILVIQKIWESTLDPAIVRSARPVALKGKILLVYVGSSAWLQQLRFQRVKLVETINRASGEELVSEIKFKIGPV